MRKSAFLFIAVSTLSIGILGCGSNSEVITTSELQRRDCLTNLRFLGRGMQMYKTDYEQRYPLAYNWSNSLVSYMQNRDVYACPVVNPRRDSYAMVQELAEAADVQVPYPAEQIWFFEADGGRNFVGSYAQLVGTPRHEGSDNYTFADGRVKTIPRSQAASLGWDTLIKH